MDILDIVNSFIKDNQKTSSKIEDKETELSKSEIVSKEKDLNQGSLNLNIVEEKTSISKDPLTAEIIIAELGRKQSIASIAKHYGVEFTQVNKLLRDAGYRFDSFFRIWTKDSGKSLILEAISILNKGTTLYDYAFEFIENKNERLLFADELRRKIESFGYLFDQKSKRWIAKNQNNINIKETILPKTLLEKQSIKNANENIYKTLTCTEIVHKLNMGVPLKKIEEETGENSTELRITLKSEGYKYDSLFKIWTNVDRNIILDKIAKEVLNNKSTIESNAVLYNLTKKDLLEQLTLLGYKFESINSLDGVVQQEEDLREINSKHEEQLVRKTEKTEEHQLMNLSSDEFILLKEILNEWKNHKEDTKTKKEVKIYLNDPLLNRLEEYSESNNITKSNLIGIALEDYFNKINSKQHDLLKKNFDEQTVLNKTCNVGLLSPSEKKTEQIDNLETNLVIPEPRTYTPEWDKEKEKLLINAILEGTRIGRTLSSIIEDVSKRIDIPAAKCQSYWYTNVPKHYKQMFYQIKQEQEDWTDEDVKMLEYLLGVEFSKLSIYEALPLASERLNRHIDVVRKKWFEVRRENS
ncbi:hypothetical protein V7146_16140 [Gottfriedia acidiceleris]|uniref:hypothetical protein n=1 Tax=Gottfriedia acidiceleris TaxID=371036 RepID=UPI002FFDBC3A